MASKILGNCQIGVVIITTVLAGLGLAALVSGVEENVRCARSETMERSRFGVSVMTDKATYTVGDTIALTLKVFNYTKEEVTFHFRNSQRYDFIIENEKGNKIWRWSDGRMFAQVLGKETLGPDHEEIIYRAEYKSKLEPGNYKITGILVAKPIPMSANIAVSISNPFRNLPE